MAVDGLADVRLEHFLIVEDVSDEVASQQDALTLLVESGNNSISLQQRSPLFLPLALFHVFSRVLLGSLEIDTEIREVGEEVLVEAVAVGDVLRFGSDHLFFERLDAKVPDFLTAHRHSFWKMKMYQMNVFRSVGGQKRVREE